ncbi:toll/interleukin-1 receptor domain-containing protein [Vibrio parahaemolyticus]
MQIYLSYCFSDEKIVNRVRETLKSNSLDVVENIIDSTVGQSLTSYVSEKISTSDAVLFFISKNSEKSAYLQYEMSIAISNRSNGKKVKLIPVLLDRNVDIPFFLKEFVYLDLSDSAKYEESMEKLLHGLDHVDTVSVNEELSGKIHSLEIEQAMLRLQKAEYEHRKQSLLHRTMTLFVGVITVAISFISLLVLFWLTKSDASSFQEFSSYSGFAGFILGSVSSLVASILCILNFLKNKGGEDVTGSEARHDR